MTNNEQRAHDLTIAMLPILFKAKIDTGEDWSSNFFNVYVERYKTLLNDFNRVFPSDR